MSRLLYSVVCACCLSVLSFSAVGCGDSGNTVIEDTRPAAEIDQAEADYEKEMEESESSDVTE